MDKGMKMARGSTLKWSFMALAATVGAAAIALTQCGRDEEKTSPAQAPEPVDMKTPQYTILRDAWIYTAPGGDKVALLQKGSCVRAVQVDVERRGQTVRIPEEDKAYFHVEASGGKEGWVYSYMFADKPQPDAECKATYGAMESNAKAEIISGPSLKFYKPVEDVYLRHNPVDDETPAFQLKAGEDSCVILNNNAYNGYQSMRVMGKDGTFLATVWANIDMFEVVSGKTERTCTATLRKREGYEQEKHGFQLHN